MTEHSHPQHPNEAVFPAQQISRRKIRTELIGQGQRMSNWLFNLKQSARVPQDVRDEARMLQEAWDGIVHQSKACPGK
jgi:hypothetical protein